MESRCHALSPWQRSSLACDQVASTPAAVSLDSLRYGESKSRLTGIWRKEVCQAGRQSTSLPHSWVTRKHRPGFEDLTMFLAI